ncbi:MAG: 2-C-methyl-D-erythritol 2,4-cyclodiphosphate synthase [Monoglobales bacterium]
MRIGNGYDVHAFKGGRKLILGGVEIPHDKGLLGHSDADVLVHAIMDALLGAAALFDIGQHFPDTSDEYKDIDSLLLLERVGKLIYEKGYEIENIDSIIVAQKPKLMKFIPQMRQKIACSLGIDTEKVNVKATTTEKLGFEGREEGIASYAVCLLK